MKGAQTGELDAGGRARQRAHRRSERASGATLHEGGCKRASGAPGETNFKRLPHFAPVCARQGRNIGRRYIFARESPARSPPTRPLEPARPLAVTAPIVHACVRATGPPARPPGHPPARPLAPTRPNGRPRPLSRPPTTRPPARSLVRSPASPVRPPARPLAPPLPQ